MSFPGHLGGGMEESQIKQEAQIAPLERYLALLLKWGESEELGISPIEVAEMHDLQSHPEVVAWRKSLLNQVLR